MDERPASARRTDSLALAFWLTFLLPWLAAHLALDGLASWMALHGAPLMGGSISWLIAWPLCALVLAWGTWRTVRAARAHAAGGGPAATRALALAAVAGALLFTAANAVLHVLPRMPAAWLLARGHHESPSARVQGAGEGHKFRLQGPLAVGDGERIATRVGQAGAGGLLELDATGGPRGEVLRVAAALSIGGWRTRFVGPCEMNCVLLFLAGRDRQVLPEGRLGLHRLASASLHPLWRARVRHEEAAQWRRAGLAPMLVLKALSAPPGQPWQPAMDELIITGLVGVPGRPLDVVLPPAQAPASEWLPALRSNPLWLSLEQRLPGLLAQAAQTLQAARDAGASGAGLQVQAQRAIQTRLPDLLREADIGLRELHARLPADRLAALARPTDPDCRRLLAADPALLRELPATLREREAGRLADVATEAPPDAPARGPGAREKEVLSRALAEGAPGRLQALGRPERHQSLTTGCQQARPLLWDVLRLPPAVRRLALRWMYDRP